VIINLLRVRCCVAVFLCIAARSFAQTNALPPSNDFFTNRIVLSGTSPSATATNIAATKEIGEPNHAGNPGGHSVWWTWTAPGLGTVTIDTTGSSFDTLLAAYTGSVVSNLTLVRANDDEDVRIFTSKVRFNVTSGTQYQIAVDGFSNTNLNAYAAGTILFHLKFAPDTTAPKVSISSPVANARLTNSTVTVTGTATDNIAVNLVLVRLENANGNTDFQSPAGTNKWSITYNNLAPGANTIRVRAIDTTGNFSGEVTRTFQYILLNPAAGNYAGLFFDANGVAHQSSGLFTAKVTSKGTFTAKLLLAGKPVPFSGTFSAIGASSNFIARIGLPSLTVSLQANSNDTEVITGVVSDGVWSSELTANRATFISTVNPCTKNGKYTLIIPGAEESLAQPGGDSFSAVTVDAAGKVKIKGALADGTKLSQKIFLSKQNLWPLYVSLYAGNGSVLSWLTFTNLPGTEIEGLVSWIKLPQAIAKFYPMGFTNVTGVIASTYTLSNPALSFSTGQVSFATGNISENFTNEVMLGIDNKVVNLSSNKLSLTITPANGFFKGSVIDPNSASPIPFNGVVLQKQNFGAGFFLGTNQSGRVTFGL
jgi:hypothetical protein